MFYVAVFPLILSLYIPTLICLCYVQGLLNSHFYPILPLVSDTANYMPEAAIFTLSITLVGILFLITSTIRFFQLQAIISSKAFQEMLGIPDGNKEELYSLRSKFKKINILSYLCGIVISFSCCATGAFRFAETFALHNLMAGGIFFGSPIYMCLQTYFSYKFVPNVNSYQMYRVRFYITVFAIGIVVVFGSSMLACQTLFNKDFFNPIHRIFWSPVERGFFVHVLNSISEWIFLLSVSPYIFTFAFDFSRITFQLLKIDYNFLTS